MRLHVDVHSPIAGGASSVDLIHGGRHYLHDGIFTHQVISDKVSEGLESVKNGGFACNIFGHT